MSGTPTGGTGRRWLVDAMNVIGSRPDGWWRDRAAAARRLVELLDAFSGPRGEEVAVVFDGRPAGVEGRGRVSVVFTRPGRDAADAEIARILSGEPDPGSVTVVSSDAAVEREARRLGARVVGAGEFRRLLDAPT